MRDVSSIARLDQQAMFLSTVQSKVKSRKVIYNHCLIHHFLSHDYHPLFSSACVQSWSEPTLELLLCPLLCCILCSKHGLIIDPSSAFSTSLWQEEVARVRSATGHYRFIGCKTRLKIPYSLSVVQCTIVQCSVVYIVQCCMVQCDVVQYSVV